MSFEQPMKTKLMHNDVAVSASAELLRCPMLHASGSSADKYRQLSDRLGLDFSSIARVFDALPIFQEGPKHAATRVALAQVLASGKTGRAENLESCLASYDLLGIPGEYDLVQQIVRPSVDRYFSDIVGIDLTALSIADVPLILSDTIGVRKRVRAETQIKAMLAALHEGFPDEESVALVLRVVLVVLGHDAVIGATTTSIVHLLAEQHGRTFAEIAYPENYPRTGVPFVHRKVAEPLEIDGETLEADQDITLLLDVFEEAAHDGDRHLFFGHGRHLCLGRTIALQYWQGVTRKLSGIGLSPKVTALKETTNSVFRTPSVLKIRIN